MSRVHKKKSRVVDTSGSGSENEEVSQQPRRSTRQKSCSKRCTEFFESPSPSSSPSKRITRQINKISINDEMEDEEELHRQPPKHEEMNIFEKNINVDGKTMFGFNTPKKRDQMLNVAMKTPKVPKTPVTDKKNIKLPKTPHQLRKRIKTQIAQIVNEDSVSDFSPDSSEYEPTESENSSEETAEDENENENENSQNIESKTSMEKASSRNPTSVSKSRTKHVTKDFIPESDGYFTTRSSSKIHTSNHTLNRLKNPRLPADRLFSLLAEMKLSTEHETAIAKLIKDYESNFPKWMKILNEGFNIIAYGLGSKRALLQKFHNTMLSESTVLVVNGFFPCLTLKNILDSITDEILEIGNSPTNPYEAVNSIEEEMSANPEMHLYLIVHNIDGTMLRNAKAQEIISRLAKIQNIHLVASIDHINTPLLWDHNKLCNYNFSWWDCTTMLPYTDETAFENSLLIQGSGELALSSMRSVFLSLTTNSRGIFMMIVKYQLKHESNPNYQGMAFKDLYWNCREAFLVSSDLALRAQLTEFLDHKLVKSKRNIDGAELLSIPIESSFLQQFIEEQEQQSSIK